MITGIYKISFTGTSKVYIGKGKDIAHRWSSHQFKLTNGTHSKKMQEAYSLYGMPSLEVILECEYSELNENENLAIDIYNAVDNGFNTLRTAESTPDGSGTPGELHGMSKLPNQKVLEVFWLLLDPANTLKSISSDLGISYRIVSHISSGSSHTWIKSTYPKEYADLIGMKGARHSVSNSAKSRGVIYGIAVSPEGKEYTVDHLTNFCREHLLDPGSLSKVLKGKLKQHKKWTLK